MSLARLSKSQLMTLAADLRAGRISSLGDDAPELSALGLGSGQLASVIDLLLKQRESQPQHRTELVWSGPEGAFSATRDTSVVIDELLSSATERVLLSTYVVHQPKVALGGLLSRMAERPNLRVRLFVNAMKGMTIEQFSREFWSNWGSTRRPDVFYDPRSLEPGAKAVLHAKCVVVDGRHAFVTSANLTESAQERNFELGLLVDDRGIANAIESQFESLIQTQRVRPLPA